MTIPDPQERSGGNGYTTMANADFQAIVRRLDALVQEFEALPYPQIREKVFDLLQTVDALHRTALSRLVELLRQQGQPALVDRALDDPLVRMLLVLYELADAPLEVEQPGHSVTYIALEQISTRPKAEPEGPAFKDLTSLEEVPPDTLRLFEVDGQQILVVHLEDGLFATRNQCPGSMAPLNLGIFNPPVLMCPWHNEPFDMRTGQRLDGQREPRLTMLPVSVVNGRILVGLGGRPSLPLGAQ